MSKVDDAGGNDKSIVCPFYKWQDRCRIACEGVSKGNVVSLVFGDCKDKTDYKIEHCRNMGRYHVCRIYLMLMEKYADEK